LFSSTRSFIGCSNFHRRSPSASFSCRSIYAHCSLLQRSCLDSCFS
jgi:hypothetical protein